jgi:hypothetical protein
VRITSLSPRARFSHKMSWHVDIGVTRLEDAGCAGYCYAARAAFGTGLTFASSGGRVALFSLLDGRLLSGPALDGLAGLPVRAGLGPTGGLRVRLAPRMVSLTTAEWIWLPLQEPFATWEARSVLRLGLMKSFALDLEALIDARAATARLAALLYF